MTTAISFWRGLGARLEAGGQWLPPLLLRGVMAWEYFESGREKLHGSNWFTQLQDQFPFPFNIMPADLSWFMATWIELGGAALLLLGLATRAAAFSLLLLTFVATAAVHWPDMWSMWSDLAKGYAISDSGHGNYKLPLLFSIMLLPLIFSGAGRVSLDHWLARRVALAATTAQHDLLSVALAFAILALPFLFLLPLFGAGLLLVAVLCAVLGRQPARR